MSQADTRVSAADMSAEGRAWNPGLFPICDISTTRIELSQGWHAFCVRSVHPEPKEDAPM